MHEYHAVESLVRQAIEKARANNASRVTKINLVAGPRLGFEESSIRMYFENLIENTIAAGAQLYIEWKKEPISPSESGREFYIEDIEVEKKE